MLAKRLAVLACLAAPIIDAVLTAAGADQEDYRTVQSGGDSRQLTVPSLRQEEDSREKEYDDDNYNYDNENIMIDHSYDDEDALIVKNREELKRTHLEATGRDLSDDDIDGAIRSAHERGFQIVAPGQNVTWEEGGSRKLLAQKKNYVFVSGLSPGWDENYGRNEFYCAAVKKINWKTMRPKKGERLVLSDCFKTNDAQILFNYQTLGRLMAVKILDIIGQKDWCLETRNNSTSKLYINRCELSNVLQQFSFDDTQKTWGLEVIKNEIPGKCFTAKPPKAGKNGGGRIQLQNCTDTGRTREAQVFRPCEIRSGCTFDGTTNFLNCDLEARCS